MKTKNIGFVLVGLGLLLSACGPLPAKHELAATEIVNSSPGRFGTTKLQSVGSSNVTGVFSAQDNGDGTTKLSVQLNPAEDINPWGIFAKGDCKTGVPTNTRPAFTLSDIEAGHREEKVETATYASFPGNAIVIIYGISPDGAQHMVACGGLGPPSTSGVSSPSASSIPACTPSDQNNLLTPATDNWLAFSATHDNNGDIYVIDASLALQNSRKAAVRRLTTDPADDFDPTWSPSGNRIAFRSQRDGNDEIYVMNADGSCQTDITNDPAGDWSPAWSPNGTQIAYAHFFDNNSYTDIALIKADGTGLVRLTTTGGEYPSWSPDGTRIAYASARTGNYEIYVMNADGTGQTQLTDNPAYDMSPSWSPDGKKIAFDTQRDYFPPLEVGIGPEFEIHVINADGSGDTRLTKNRDEDRFPAWGPNGRIAFTENGSLLTMKADGSDLAPLFDRIALQLDSNIFPDWHSGP